MIFYVFISQLYNVIYYNFFWDEQKQHGSTHPFDCVDVYYNYSLVAGILLYKCTCINVGMKLNERFLLSSKYWFL